MRERGPTNNPLFNILLLKTYDKVQEFDHITEEASAHFNLADLQRASSEMNSRWYMTADRPITSHRRFLGKYIVLLKKVLRKFVFRWYINPIVDKQTGFNSSITNAMNEFIKYIVKNEEMINKLQNDLAQITKLLEDEKKNRNSEMQIMKQELFQEIVRVRSTTENIFTGLKDDLSVISEGMQKLTTVEKLDFDYYSFEKKFRGSFELIKERQTRYLEYFLGRQNVLDIGCGRGEFLELLVENDISVVGIDLDIDMVNSCRERGFNAQHIDAIQYLQSVEDNSLGGIFLSHVVEHLAPQQLIKLIKLSYTKLASTANLVVETPNATSLYIFANAFYQDMTHNKPVHPGTLKFIIESAGYKKINLQFISPVDPSLQLEKIVADEVSTNISDSNILNNNIEKINSILFGYQDYFISAQK